MVIGGKFIVRGVFYLILLVALAAPAYAAEEKVDPVVAATDAAFKTDKKTTKQSASKATSSKKKQSTARATSSSKKQSTAKASSSNKKQSVAKAKTSKKVSTAKAVSSSGKKKSTAHLTSHKKQTTAKANTPKKQETAKLEFSDQPISLLSPSAGVAGYMMDETVAQAQLTPLLGETPPMK